MRLRTGAHSVEPGTRNYLTSTDLCPAPQKWGDTGPGQSVNKGSTLAGGLHTCSSLGSLRLHQSRPLTIAEHCPLPHSEVCPL